MSPGEPFGRVGLTLGRPVRGFIGGRRSRTPRCKEGQTTMTKEAKVEALSDGARHDWTTRFSACPECVDDDSADHTEDTEDTEDSADSAAAAETLCGGCAGTKQRCDWCFQAPTRCTCQPEND